METYIIRPNDQLRFRAENNQPFFGANSLLSIKAVRVPFDRKNEDIRLRVRYRNLSGDEFSFSIILYPPYFFEAITPNLNDMINVEKVSFQWAEIVNENPFELTISASLNTNLHNNLNTFRKDKE